MISQLTLDTYRNAFTTVSRNDINITVLRDDLPPDIQDHLLERIQYISQRSSLDLGYNIMRDVVSLLPSTLDELATFDAYDQTPDIASVYTYESLQYLTINNQYDITQILIETNADDIATACSMWYDITVQNSLADLVDTFTAE